MKLLKTIIIVLTLLFVIGCDEKEKEIIDVKLCDYEQRQDIDDFSIYDLFLLVTYDDNTINNVNISKDMISESDLFKLNELGYHNIKINYLDQVVILNISLTNYYNVSYILDGNIVNTQIVEHGENAITPDEIITNKEGYTFYGWNHDGKNITENTIIIGKYEIHKYEVKFIIDDVVIDTQQVQFGNDAVLPNLEKEGYTFTGWNDDGKNITCDRIISGSFEINNYEVLFMMGDMIIDTQIVEHGKDACYPTNFHIDTYIFNYWEESIYNIKNDTIINANYEREINGVRFMPYTKMDMIKKALNRDNFTILETYDLGKRFLSLNLYRKMYLFKKTKEYYICCYSKENKKNWYKFEKIDDIQESVDDLNISVMYKVVKGKIICSLIDEIDINKEASFYFEFSIMNHGLPLIDGFQYFSSLFDECVFIGADIDTLIAKSEKYGIGEIVINFLGEASEMFPFAITTINGKKYFKFLSKTEAYNIVSDKISFHFSFDYLKPLIEHIITLESHIRSNGQIFYYSGIDLDKLLELLKEVVL